MITESPTHKLDRAVPVAAFGPLRTVAVNNTTLAYSEQGAGEPVVFVHGTASDLRSWQQQVPAIGMSHRAIAYSRRYARPNEISLWASTIRCSLMWMTSHRSWR